MMTALGSRSAYEVRQGGSEEQLSPVRRTAAPSAELLPWLSYTGPPISQTIIQIQINIQLLSSIFYMLWKYIPDLYLKSNKDLIFVQI